MNQEIKFKIVNKSKDGMLLSPSKGVKPVKMGWDEFKANYIVKENNWAYPTEECIKKINEINTAVAEAAIVYMQTKCTEGTPEVLEALTLLGEKVQNIENLAGCTTQEAIGLIKDFFEPIKSFGNKKHPKKKFNKNKENKPVPVKEEQRPGTLSDNPALVALKEKLEKKK